MSIMGEQFRGHTPLPNSTELLTISPFFRPHLFATHGDSKAPAAAPKNNPPVTVAQMTL
jgi:hypothetical protein